MSFSAAERRYLLKAPMVGHRLMQYLEGLGICTLEKLAALEEDMLARLVAHHSGLPGWETHSMARQAIANALAAAKAWRT